MSELNNMITRLDEDWLQMKVPLPFSLKWVNAYLLPEKDGQWTIIDPGLHTPETASFWIASLAELGIEWKAIDRIVLTHHHPDHYGMAGWIQERSGSPVFMSEVALSNAHRLWGDGETFSVELTEAFERQGLAPELAPDILEHMRSFAQKVSPQPIVSVNLIQPGDFFEMGGKRWETIGGEGHAPGHLSFYHRESGKLLCGDQVLPDISPNIGWMPGGDPDPLGSFLSSLEAMDRLKVSMAYPGHRDPFPKFAERMAELLEHHESRLLKMLELIGEHAITPFEVCELLFGARLRSNAHQLRFALAETIAHLVHLEKRGLLIREEFAGPGERTLIRYRQTVLY
jgi:glyoxylase-like metal-dependent hydrolase (beta-lactamase superfamily II)